MRATGGSEHLGLLTKHTSARVEVLQKGPPKFERKWDAQDVGAAERAAGNLAQEALATSIKRWWVPKTMGKSC